MDGRLILCSALWLIVHGVSHNKNDAGLKKVPNNIPSNVDSIYLSRNKITIIRDYAFEHISGLEQLYINENSISTVQPRAFYGTAIKILSLKDNLLEAIPNAGDISSTVKIISLNNNLIEVVKREDLEDLTKLETLRLEGNPLTTMPDVHRLLPLLKLLDVSSVEFFCCSSIAYLKDVPYDVLLVNDKPCGSPPHLAGLAWTHITKDQMGSCGMDFSLLQSRCKCC